MIKDPRGLREAVRSWRYGFLSAVVSDIETEFGDAI